MERARPLPPEEYGIFRGTYNGVPNPLVPFVHAYPTRYHGAIFTSPMPGYQYQPRYYQKAPFVGIDGLGATMLPSITGSRIIDAALGAAVGYFAAPKSRRAQDTAIGAAAGALGGTLGILAFMAYELHSLKKKRGAA